jgi:hypothetical protein
MLADSQTASGQGLSVEDPEFGSITDLGHIRELVRQAVLSA